MAYRERDELRYDKRGHTAHITLNRPGQMNALNHALREAINDAIADGEADDNILSFIITGDVSLTAGLQQTSKLNPGDIFLVDGASAPQVVIDVRNQCRLLQIDVAADWPGPKAELQRPGTINPRQGTAANIKRIYKGADDKAYFTEFQELFPDAPDQWSAPRQIAGFRMLCWEDGEMDFHPCVINQLGVVSSGELEVEVGSGEKQIFRAGDICFSEDRTGEGHRNRVRGAMHTTNFVIETEHLWPYTP